MARNSRNIEERGRKNDQNNITYEAFRMETIRLQEPNKICKC